MKTILINKFKQCSVDDILSGMFWYEKAHNICKDISANHNIPLWKVVGMLAALSPRNKWHRNLLDVESCIISGELASVATFGANKQKALRILELSEFSEIWSTLNGRKITNFFCNILYFKDSGPVTVDIWAARAVSVDDLRSKHYSSIALAYREAADSIGILPHELQAIIWCHERQAAA